MKQTTSFIALFGVLVLLGAGCAATPEVPPVEDPVEPVVVETPEPEPEPEPSMEEPTQEEGRVRLADFTEPPTTRPGVLVDEELLNREVLLNTSKGAIRLSLRGDIAPQTVSNFLILAHTGFYDGLTFHRFEPGFVIQGGDPDGTGRGGPGYTVPAEINEELPHDPYVLATARQGDQVNPLRASSGSQFYITLADASFLNGAYTTFGTVVEGTAFVDALRADDTITSIEILPTK